MKYKDWLPKWLDNYVKATTKKRTHKKYLKQIENHILPRLGEYELDELCLNVLQEFTVDLTRKGYATNTISGIVSLLKASLKRAVVVGIINTQYADGIVRPKAHEKRIICFSKDEQRMIERYVLSSKKNKLYGIVLCLYTGIRLGELLALKWTDVDFAKGILSISKSCYDEWIDRRYVKIVETPKTLNGYRMVPIPKQLIPHLKEMKKKSVGEYVISGKSSHGVGVRSYQRMFEVLLVKTGLAHKGFHSLRHTFATRALEVGMDVKTLSEILGHGNPAITLKRYAHSMLEYKTAMMNKIGKLLM